VVYRKGKAVLKLNFTCASRKLQARLAVGATNGARGGSHGSGHCRFLGPSVDLGPSLTVTDLEIYELVFCPDM